MSSYAWSSEASNEYSNQYGIYYLNRRWPYSFTFTQDGESSSDPVSLDNIDVAMTTRPGSTGATQDVVMVEGEQPSSSKSNKGKSYMSNFDPRDTY